MEKPIDKMTDEDLRFSVASELEYFHSIPDFPHDLDACHWFEGNIPLG